MDRVWRRLSATLSRRAGSLFRHHRFGLYILAVLVGLASGLGAVLSFGLGRVEDFERGRIETLARGKSEQEAQTAGYTRMIIGGVIDMALLKLDDFIGGRQITRSLARAGSDTLEQIMGSPYVSFPKEYITAETAEGLRKLINLMLGIEQPENSAA